jgi:hypothetical protein
MLERHPLYLMTVAPSSMCCSGCCRECSSSSARRSGSRKRTMTPWESHTPIRLAFCEIFGETPRKRTQYCLGKGYYCLGKGYYCLGKGYYCLGKGYD